MYFFRSRDLEIHNQLTRKSNPGTIPIANNAPIVWYFKIIRIENTKPITFPAILIKITFLNCENPLTTAIRKRFRAKSGRDKATTLKTISKSYSSPKIRLFQYSAKTKTGRASVIEAIKSDQKTVEITFVNLSSSFWC